MLEVNNISASYGQTRVLWDVSIRVNRGEIVAILGSNGSGKTTLMKSIMDTVNLIGGDIYFEERSLIKVATYRRVDLGLCLVPEGRGLFVDLTVLDNLLLGAFNKKARENLASNLETVFQLFPDLAKREQQVAGTLSGGQQQMVAIGRGFMSQPRLLLLDEPSLGLAPLLTQKIFEVIKQITATGVTVLLVEQNVKASLKIADRAYLVENGKVVGGGLASDLCEDAKVLEAYLGFEGY